MATTTLMIMRLLSAAVTVEAAPQQALELYPAAPMAAASQAFWNSSLNSWGGSVYNDSVRLPSVPSGLPLPLPPPRARCHCRC
jgi:hypothetical protein